MLELRYDIDILIEQNNTVMTEGFLTLIDKSPANEVVISSWPCRSGGHGKGTLPHGIYEIRSVKALNVSSASKPYAREGFPWYISLRSPGYVKRSGFGIHPDGNIVGTLGCLGITERDIGCFSDIKDVFEDLNDKKLLLKVY